ncbi:thiamine diphosphokinase [Pseudooceanicola onchidii]|uniref:thiamine diphosphokinase n=1 Tax=Pseudooceanicola onchidii TaxID=2562279 RepID=UPI0010AB220B|nr:thiamine diphosphokinase [Pseudooceanicola onchidii]
MTEEIVISDSPVLLLGGADRGGALRQLTTLRHDLPLDRMPVVAADGGAGLARAAGLPLTAVIGDFDSLTDEDRAAIDPAVLHHTPDQLTTDFDKALSEIRAPLVFGVGFTGGRLDHQLAVMTGLTLQPDRRCIVIGDEDITCLCPPDLTLDLTPGDRLSLYPMAEVGGRSEGLDWPIDGLRLRPDGRVGTSNRVSDGQIRLQIDAPRMLLILPRPALRPLLAGLSLSDARWPVRAG